MFLSACSGIYKSDNAGEMFHKIQGIPMTARRTRKLLQDPVNRQVVYAGTTEGLYKTVDGGKTFPRMTGPDVIVNDVWVDPNDTKHVLLATDRSGVLYSRDGAASFVASNDGFSGRKVEALLVDNSNPSRMLVGVANDKTYGGVFASTDGGTNWNHIGEGLEGGDVFALAQAQDGTVLAGTNHGIFILSTDTNLAGGNWRPRNTIQNSMTKKVTQKTKDTKVVEKIKGKTVTVLKKGKSITIDQLVKDRPHEFEGRVYALDLSGDVWLASTSSGLLTSKDHGATWQGGLVMGSGDYFTAAAHGTTMAAAKWDKVVVSTDAGQTWKPVELPTGLTRIYRAVFSADGTLWLGAREGVYFTRDQAQTWEWFERLPFRDVNDLYYDPQLNKLLASSRHNDFVYFIDPVPLTWKWREIGGYPIMLIRSAGDKLLAASLYDGVVVETRAARQQTAKK